MAGQPHIDILATSDMHAHWESGIRHVLGKIQRTDLNTSIAIDNGDLLTGSILGTYLAAGESQWECESGPHPLLRALDAAGVEVWVPGNHDLDYGAGFLRRAVAGLHQLTPVCANLADHTGELLFPASKIVERAGMSIAVVGAITGQATRLTRYESASQFRISAPIQAVTDEVTRIRDEVDAVIVAYHGGFVVDPDTQQPMHYPTGEDEAYDLFAIPGVQGIIAGHQHWERAGLVQTGAEMKGYVQPGYGGNVVGRIRLANSPETARLTPQYANLLTVESDGNVMTDTALTDAHAEALSWDDREAPEMTLSFLHRMIQARLDPVHRTLGSALAVEGTPRTRSDVRTTFHGIYGASRIRMTYEEYACAVRAAQEQGFVVSQEPAPAHTDEHTHVDLVINASLRNFMPRSVVVEDYVIDWHDEAAYRLKQERLNE